MTLDVCDSEKSDDAGEINDQMFFSYFLLVLLVLMDYIFFSCYLVPLFLTLLFLMCPFSLYFGVKACFLTVREKAQGKNTVDKRS